MSNFYPTINFDLPWSSFWILIFVSQHSAWNVFPTLMAGATMAVPALQPQGLYVRDGTHSSPTATMSPRTCCPMSRSRRPPTTAAPRLLMRTVLGATQQTSVSHLSTVTYPHVAQVRIKTTSKGIFAIFHSFTLFTLKSTSLKHNFPANKLVEIIWLP